MIQNDHNFLYILLQAFCSNIGLFAEKLPFLGVIQLDYEVIIFQILHLSIIQLKIKRIVMLNASLNIRQSQMSDFLYISLIGVTRTVSGLPIQHPLETIKTWMQSENQTSSQAFKAIYQQKNFKGFYSGFGINCARAISKAAYRWPLTVYIINKFRKQCKEKGWGIGVAGTAAGIVTALIESVILCPFQRIKTWMMTSNKNVTYVAFWNFLKNKNLYDGFQPVLTKQMLSWVSFLGTQEYMKELIYHFQNKDPKQHLTNTELAIVSMMVCLINTLFVMPADYVKTHCQKYDCEPSSKNMWNFCLKCYRRNGLMGFYRGGAIKMVYYNINAMLTVPLMEKVLRMVESYE